MKYRILARDGQKHIAIPRGFSWGAAIFSTFWAIYKGFWIGATVMAGLNAVVRVAFKFASNYGVPFIYVLAWLLWIAIIYLFGKYANFALLAYLTSKGYEVIDEVEASTEEQALKRYTVRNLSLSIASVGASGEPNFSTKILGGCPNCDAHVDLELVQCPHCGAQFGPNSAWKILKL